VTPLQTFAVLGELAAEAAHELQNILQIISSSAFVARVELERGETAAAQPHLAKVEKHARLAHAIVDDLLALARGEPVRKEPVLLRQVVAEARADLDPAAAAWTDSIPEDLEAHANPALLVRLLHALYENAIQAAAPRAPSLVTRARREAERTLIEVADDGPGVPAAIAATLFDPLVTARPGGTGLGLALARRIAMAHGGSLVLEPGEARGATFRLELPL
jgi:two-component system C4-dicarboxylate transport sensor histidine kinase DctB